MTKSQKIYEAIAIVHSVQRSLLVKFSGLGLSLKNRTKLAPHASKVEESLERFENELLSILEDLKKEAA